MAMPPILRNPQFSHTQACWKRPLLGSRGFVRAGLRAEGYSLILMCRVPGSHTGLSNNDTEEPLAQGLPEIHSEHCTQSTQHICLCLGRRGVQSAVSVGLHTGLGTQTPCPPGILISAMSDRHLTEGTVLPPSSNGTK